MGKRLLAFVLAAALASSWFENVEISTVYAAVLEEPDEVVMADATGREESVLQDSLLWVNPLYPGAQKQAESNAGQTVDVAENFVESTGINTYTSVKSAAKYIKKQMMQRKTVIELHYTGVGLYKDALIAMQAELLEEVFAVTTAPLEGDYLHYHCTNIRQGFAYTSLGNEAYIKWEIQYVSSASQEKTVKSRVSKIVKSLGLSKCSDADKIKKIHDYICENVEYYDDGTLRVHSAYGALEDGEAVCQGYATLTYALGVQAGLKIRCISGTSNGQSHLWNIVRVNGKWFNLDTTWDDAGAGISYRYFLKSNADFPKHTRDREYQSSKFVAKYPINSKSYTGSVGTPTLKSVKSTKDADIKLTWSKVGNASGYQIYYASKKSGKYKKLKTIKGGTVTSYTVPDMNIGQTYYFKIRAYNSVFDTKTGKYSAVKSVTAAPAKVTLSKVTAGKKSLKVKWKTVGDVKGYEIVLSYKSGARTIKKTVRVTASKKSTQSKTVTGLKSGKVYSVKVRAYVPGTKQRICGEYSSTIKKTVK